MLPERISSWSVASAAIRKARSSAEGRTVPPVVPPVVVPVVVPPVVVPPVVVPVVVAPVVMPVVVAAVVVVPVVSAGVAERAVAARAAASRSEPSARRLGGGPASPFPRRAVPNLRSRSFGGRPPGASPIRSAAVRTVCALLLAALAATPAAALPARPAGSVDLLQAFRAELPKVRRATRVPVLLPDSLLLAGRAPRIFADAGATRGGWVLTLAGHPRCGGANACFIASFEAQRGKPLPDRPNVRLAGGARGYYHPISCGASCTPASLWFVHGGVLYAWQIKDPPRNTRGALVQMANEAIRAGPR